MLVLMIMSMLMLMSHISVDFFVSSFVFYLNCAYAYACRYIVKTRLYFCGQFVIIENTYFIIYCKRMQVEKKGASKSLILFSVIGYQHCISMLFAQKSSIGKDYLVLVQ